MARIEDYALLGDLQSGALVATTGSIDWLCLPRFDSPACFAALLDTPDAGHWQIAPESGGTCTSRRYVDDTLVLETEWVTPEGTIRVIDFMPPRGHAPDVVRIVEGVSGAVAVRSTLRLRFDYGRVVPWVRHHADQMIAVAGPDAVRLRTPVPTHGQDWATVSEITVRAGDRIPFVLTWHHSHERTPAVVDPEVALRETLDFWTTWSQGGTPLSGPYRDAIMRSLLTLKALTYQPTGGIVAALTTSLPEQIGGPRNWDYRYCWLRDSTYTLQALVSAGFLTEARAWREWLLRAVAGDPAELQIMYGLDGTRRLPEAELPWLAGYEGSRPVRTGNAASDQLQLDVWGETLDGLCLARDAGLGTREDAWDVQTALMEHLEGAWDQPDNGLWEVRGARRHFTHSKVMAWVAADRMSRAVRTHPHLHGPAARWEALRDTIHADVIAHGYDEDRRTFTQSYGSDALDASLLLIPRVGFLPATDPRVRGTIAAIQRDLTQDGFVRRYQTAGSDDGLPGGEGLFLACSFWLV
ncbi:MAG TPA: glycoside hydrolase family 15 protein, partial [Cellulomonadaceae bacterium]|nr:glycoside hydrolase family 15 protein [Cellulomonadaceae bacterium]